MNSDAWLDIPGEDIDVAEIMRQIRERIARREGTIPAEDEDAPAMVASALWQEMIEDWAEEFKLGETVSIRRRDCDVMPRNYVIDWRIPILGPIHSVVRRVINDEIRRYLMPSLKKQSTLNRRLLRALKELSRENAELRRELETLREQEE